MEITEWKWSRKYSERHECDCVRLDAVIDKTPYTSIEYCHPEDPTPKTIILISMARRIDQLFKSKVESNRNG